MTAPVADGSPRWEQRGPHPVLSAEVDGWAEVDARQVAVFAQFPQTDPSRSLPVLVLAHGLGGSHLGYASLGAHFASHGFAVLHPQFLDSLHRLEVIGSLTAAGTGEADSAAAVRAAMLPLLFDPAHWRSRLQRLRAVVDSLADQRHLPVRLEPSAVAVAGHSYGAYTTQMLLGVSLDGPGRDIDTSPHPAVSCAILLSPQGSGDRGLTPTSWEKVGTPLLVVTATRDFGPHGEGLPWRREPFDRCRSALRHLSVVRDGDHFLGDLPSPDDDAPATGGEPSSERAVRRAVSAVALAFAEWARGDPAAGEWLRTSPFPSLLDHCPGSPGAAGAGGAS